MGTEQYDKSVQNDMVHGRGRAPARARGWLENCKLIWILSANTIVRAWAEGVYGMEGGGGARAP